jgi:hypothetical protein
MRLNKIIVTYIILLELAACSTKSTYPIHSKNDTTNVLELALKSAFYHQNLPGYSSLVRPYHFKDSILFSSNILPLSMLPANLDTIKFKVLPEKVIRLMIQKDSSTASPPNYLFVRSFEKSDTGYYVVIESLSCQQFGGGGTIGIDITKEKDSFIVKDKMSASIN